MQTEIVKVDASAPEADVITRAGETIRKGGLVAFPTETVYGLGGDALNPESSRKIYAAKGRPSDNPLIVHIARMEDLEPVCAKIPAEMLRLAEAFWPGPLTMIVPKAGGVPTETTGGLDTVAIRMPDHPVALELIRAAGGYIAAPSANASGRPSPTLAEHVAEDLDGRIEMILDGGEVGIGVESTIVDLSGEVPTILRPGYVTEEMLLRVLGKIQTDPTLMQHIEGGRPKAPGMRYRHYAPKGTMTLVEGNAKEVAEQINRMVEAAAAEGQKTGVLCTDESMGAYRADVVQSLGSREEMRAIALHLYRALREFDAQGVQVICAESFSREGFGQAVMNRLLKAAGYTVLQV
ncbi:MAG: threonylcarbamoyl-AMP synthase [Lachnospiraceae bacterium]|nr:threonylcarbamoyl-AMP synthase [Lachnospiraceae bacterium]